MAQEIKNVKLDKKIFRHTAKKSKKINVKPHISRGGIRL